MGIQSLSNQSQELLCHLFKEKEEQDQDRFLSTLEPVLRVINQKALPVADLLNPFFKQALRDLTLDNPFYRQVFSIKVLSSQDEKSFYINGLFWSQISEFVRVNYALELERMLHLKEKLFCSFTCLPPYYEMLLELDNYFKQGHFNFKNLSRANYKQDFQNFLQELGLENSLVRTFIPSQILEIDHQHKYIEIKNSHNFFDLSFLAEVEKVKKLGIETLCLNESFFDLSDYDMQHIAERIKRAGLKISLNFNSYTSSFLEKFHYLNGQYFKKIRLRANSDALVCFFNKIQGWQIDTLHLDMLDCATNKLVNRLESKINVKKTFKLTFMVQVESFKKNLPLLFNICQLQTLGLTEVSYGKLKKFHGSVLKIYKNDKLPSWDQLQKLFFHGGQEKTFYLYYTPQHFDLRKKEIIEQLCCLLDLYSIKMRFKKDAKVLVISNKSEMTVESKIANLLELLRELCQEYKNGEFSPNLRENIAIIYHKLCLECSQKNKLYLLYDILYQYHDIFDELT